MEWSELQCVCVGLLGVLLLVSGTRLYRYSIVAPGAGVGAYVGVILTMGQSDSIQLIGVGICSVVGVVTMLLVEKLAIALLCALMGGATVYYFDIFTEWYWVIVGSVIGSILFTPVFPKLLPVWMSLAGAGCITWAINKPGNIEWFLGLTILGTLIQSFFGRTVTNLDDP